MFVEILCTPEAPGSQFRSFHQRPELGPGDLGVYLVGLRAGTKAAIDSGDDIFPPQDRGIAYDALRYHLRMLDNVRC